MQACQLPDPACHSGASFTFENTANGLRSLHSNAIESTVKAGWQESDTQTASGYALCLE